MTGLTQDRYRTGRTAMAFQEEGSEAGSRPDTAIARRQTKAEWSDAGKKTSGEVRQILTLSNSYDLPFPFRSSFPGRLDCPPFPPLPPNISSSRSPSPLSILLRFPPRSLPLSKSSPTRPSSSSIADRPRDGPAWLYRSRDGPAPKLVVGFFGFLMTVGWASR